MTFDKFAQIVKKHRPDVVVHRHGDFSTKTTLSVAVQFNYGASKIYLYTGTYVQVLNRLGVPTISKVDLWNVKQTLQRLIDQHGQANLFGGVNDFASEIEAWQAELDKYKTYIVV